MIWYLGTNIGSGTAGKDYLFSPFGCDHHGDSFLSVEYIPAIILKTAFLNNGFSLCVQYLTLSRSYTSEVIVS